MHPYFTEQLASMRRAEQIHDADVYRSTRNPNRTARISAGRILSALGQVAAHTAHRLSHAGRAHTGPVGTEASGGLVRTI